MQVRCGFVARCTPCVIIYIDILLVAVRPPDGNIGRRFRLRREARDLPSPPCVVAGAGIAFPDMYLIEARAVVEPECAAPRIVNVNISFDNPGIQVRRGSVTGSASNKRACAAYSRLHAVAPLDRDRWGSVRQRVDPRNHELPLIVDAGIRHQVRHIMPHIAVGHGGCGRKHRL